MDEPTVKVVIPNPNSRPPGFWSLPGGSEGISGSIAGVNAAVDALENVPPHHKEAIKAEIAAIVDGTEFNFVKVLARAAVNKTESYRHIVGHFEITASKKNL